MQGNPGRKPFQSSKRLETEEEFNLQAGRATITIQQSYIGAFKSKCMHYNGSVKVKDIHPTEHVWQDLNSDNQINYIHGRVSPLHLTELEMFYNKQGQKL